MDQAIALVMGTFDGVEEISAGLREDVVIIYIQRNGFGKSLLFQLLPRQHTTFTSCQNAACSNDHFLQQVDYNLANVHYFCLLFDAERS